MVTTIVALDLKAAFDTIWHDGLLHKMTLLDFPIFLTKIIQQMLCSRTFAVRVDNAISEISDMDAGVPQGSVIGPTLFNIFTHDIPLNGKIELTQFADDTTIHVVHKDPARSQSILNKYLIELSKFFKDWKLKLNENKTELIHVMGQVRDTNIKLRRNTRNMKIIVGDHIVPPSSDIRLLGLRIQTNNRFTKHINIRLSQAKKTKFHLNRIFKSSKIDTSIKTNMYKLYIRPILMYASPVWCRQPQVSSHQMELLRSFERGCLRQTANIHRLRGSYKHISAEKIHDISACMRIDRFALMAHLNFYKKCQQYTGSKFHKIKRRFVNIRYSCMPELFDQHNAGNLLVNNKLEIFNTRYNGEPGLVYPTGQ